MNIDYKIVLGVLAIVIGLIGYVPYLRDVFRKRTKPHVFSWLVWGIMEVIAFLAQVSEGGGAGAWVTGVSAAVAFIVVFAALRNPDKQIRPADWLAFAGAVCGVLAWQLARDPFLAVVFVTIADFLAFLPTFRKTWYRPYEETLFEYGAASTKWIIGILALESMSVTTWLYPASLVLTNAALVVMALVRRAALRSAVATKP